MNYASESDTLQARESVYRAANESAAVFDVSSRTQLEIVGPDCRQFLHNFCTNNINALSAGHGCEAFLCNVKGRILGHVFVFAGDDSLWVECVPGCGEFLMLHLRRYHLLEDFTLTDRSAEFGELFLTGPESESALKTLGIDGADLEDMSIAVASIEADSPVQIALKRCDMFGTCGYLISLPKSHSKRTLESLSGAGIQIGSTETFELLRIEAGFPCYGIDLSDQNLAQEVDRTDRAISFEKGCYLGQEPIARIHAMGHVNRILRRFRITGNTLAKPGTPILNPNNTEKEIGTLTSIAETLDVDTFIGLGMIRTQFADPESKVTLKSDTECDAVVI